MSFRIRAVLSLLFLLAPFPLLHAQPCPVTWGSTSQISNTASSAFSPKLAVVGDTVHVTYIAGDLYYKRSTDGGETWWPEVSLIPVDSINPGAKPLSTSARHVYIAWGNKDLGGAITSIKIRRSTDSGISWLEPTVLVYNKNSFERLEAPKIASFESNVYVVCYRPTGTQQWFLTRSLDYGVTWDSLRQITFSPFGTGFGAAGELRATATGIHFTFERSIPPSGREIVYTKSTDQGATWSGIEVLSSIGGSPQHHSHSRNVSDESEDQSRCLS